MLGPVVETIRLHHLDLYFVHVHDVFIILGGDMSIYKLCITLTCSYDIVHVGMYRASMYSLYLT